MEKCGIIHFSAHQNVKFFDASMNGLGKVITLSERSSLLLPPTKKEQPLSPRTTGHCCKNSNSVFLLYYSQKASVICFPMMMFEADFFLFLKHYLELCWIHNNPRLQ